MGAPFVGFGCLLETTHCGVFLLVADVFFGRLI